MVGAPVALPTAPMSASRRQPAALPIRIARSALPRPSPGTRKVPVSMTSSPIPRSPHSTVKSMKPSTR